ncbi:TPA_exp: 5-aminolevulinic acid synthase [Trichophyton benhamiae CBS 112371]|nr:TPA_exp: 5-aminolevulinic acid synthase [Trichophyton benhamiae CBS 112371]
MESLLQQSRALCPFLKKTAPATLRALSTTTRPSSSVVGGTITNLQVVARRCPVMGKALAVQSARIALRSGEARAFGTCPRSAGAAGLVRENLHRAHGKALCPVSKKGLHTTAAQAAVVDQQARGKGRVPVPPRATVEQLNCARETFAGPKPAIPSPTAKFDYEGFYRGELDKKLKDKSYRYFNNINRLAKEFPRAHMAPRRTE